MGNGPSSVNNPSKPHTHEVSVKPENTDLSRAVAGIEQDAGVSVTIASSDEGGAHMFQGASNMTINGGTFVAVSGGATVHWHVHNIHSPGQSPYDALLALFPPNRFRAIKLDVAHKCASGTGQWFVNGALFQGWSKDNVSISGTTWCLKVIWGTGDPGTGKTGLATLAISELEKLAEDSQGSISVAYVYCRYSELVSITDILLALIRQQLERHPRLADIIGPVFAHHQREKTTPSQNELLDLLRTISVEFKTTFFVLEGLDEAPKDAQFDILRALESLTVKFFITSRPLKHLQKALQNAAFFDIVATDGDIGLLIAKRLAEDPQFAELIREHNMLKEVTETVKKKASGMFLHAALHLDLLQTCLSLGDLRKVLRQFPTTIAGIYVATMKRIEAQAPHHVQLVKIALLWLLYSYRDSLTIEDLQLALTFDPEERTVDADFIVSEARLIPLFCGLVTVDKESRLVRLVHYTAKDFLLSYLAKDQHLPNPDALLAAACFARLTAANPRLDLTTHSQISAAIEAAPLFKYAHEKWHAHGRECDEATQAVQELIVAFPPLPLPGRDTAYGHMFTADSLFPIHTAAFFNFPDLVVRLAEDVNIRTPNMRATALMLAAEKGNETIVRILLGIPDVDVNGADKLGWTTLMIAAKWGHEGIVNLLLGVAEILADAVEEDGWSALMLAASNGHENIVRALRTVPGVQVDRVNSSGSSPLIVAATRDERVVEALLEDPTVDVNRLDRCDGQSALMWAASAGRIDIVRVLLNNPGVDVNLRDRDGWPALKFALQSGHQDVVRLLIATPGCKVDLVDNVGWTILMFAARYGQSIMVDLLLELAGSAIDVNATSKHGVTALMLASYGGHVEVVRRLLSVPGVKLDLVNQEGNTALAWAREEGRDDVVQLLQNVTGV